MPEDIGYHVFQHLCFVFGRVGSEAQFCFCTLSNTKAFLFQDSEKKMHFSISLIKYAFSQEVKLM